MLQQRRKRKWIKSKSFINKIHNFDTWLFSWFDCDTFVVFSQIEQIIYICIGNYDLKLIRGYDKPKQP